MKPFPIRLKPCPKGYTKDLDKAISPSDTIANVHKKLSLLDLDIISGTRRIDTGRLGIPVYIGYYGKDSRNVTPTRKQMGKGSSVEQAEASALMELIERYSFFSFWNQRRGIVRVDWNTAKNLFGDKLVSISEIIRSVNDNISHQKAERLFNLLEWDFYPATRLSDETEVWLPLDWFRLLGEFNGTSAGNTNEESLLQAISELVERHASAIVDREKQVFPTIDPASIEDPACKKLVNAFSKEGIKLVLKDISLNMPMPVVAALAWDPATFGASSEIVFTAGAATSPAKAAIRAITEVAQLAGDFCTNSCYEASGLPKFFSLQEFEWLLDGPLVNLSSLPDIEDNDIQVELKTLLAALKPAQAYGIDITNPDLSIPAHYTIIPGFEFRERDKNQSVGLFVGRMLVEKSRNAEYGLKVLEEEFPDAHYVPFFKGQLALNRGNLQEAFRLFEMAIPMQPDNDSQAMTNFYAGYTLTLADNFPDSIPFLQQAAILSPQMKEYHNLLGVAFFKNQNYVKAEHCFSKAIKIDKGSAIDLANRGVCRKMLGNIYEARTDLEAALELDPEIEFARIHLKEIG